MTEDTRAHFDQYATDYDSALQSGLKVTGHGREYFAARRTAYLAGLLEQLGNQVNGGGLLDFGCGTGTSIPLLVEKFAPHRAVGLDQSAASIQMARSHFATASTTFIPLSEYRPGSESDLCYTNGVFHHIEPKDRNQAVQLILASLKPGGYFAFYENNPWNPGTRYVMSRIPFDRSAQTITPRAARHLLSGEGFHIVLTRYLFVFPAWLPMLQSLERLMDRYPLGAQYLVLARKPFN